MRRAHRSALSQQSSSRSDRTTPTLGQPPLAEPTSIVLGEPAPDPGLLIGLEGILETGLLHRASRTDGDGGLDVIDGGPGGSYRKEQRRFGIPARGQIPPVCCDGGCCEQELLPTFVMFFTSVPDNSSPGTVDFRV